MQIALAYNVKTSQPSTDINQQVDTEFDSPETIESIKQTIEGLGHTVRMVEATEDAFETLRRNRANIDLVFTIAEGLGGDARESQIPLFCEMLGIPYTHSSPTTHALKLDKHLTKLLVSTIGVNTPRSFFVTGNETSLPEEFNFPLIVKPNSEGSSKGVTNDSVVNSIDQLRSYARTLQSAISGKIIAEEYIAGREFTVGLLGDPLGVLPVIEQRFDFLPKDLHAIASFELKWLYEDQLSDPSQAYDCPAKIDQQLHATIVQSSQHICELLSVRDAARIDYRLDADGRLFFIEINTLPGINPDPSVISYFPLAARKAGITFSQLVETIIQSAIRRSR